MKHSHRLQRCNHKNDGFTLIEIVIALSIVAIAVLAIADAMNKHTQAAAGLEQRVLASMMASSQIALIRHEAKTSRVRTGNKSDLVKMGGHQWRVRSKITETDVERVFLVTVTVEDEAQRDEAAFATITTAVSDAF